MVTVLVWVCESKRGSWISGAFTHVQVDLNNKVTSEVSKCPLVITSSHLLCPQAKPATLYILEVDPCGTRIINIQHWRLLLLSEELLSFSAKKCKNLRGVSRFTVSVMCRENLRVDSGRRRRLSCRADDTYGRSRVPSNTWSLLNTWKSF